MAGLFSIDRLAAQVPARAVILKADESDKVWMKGMVIAIRLRR